MRCRFLWTVAAVVWLSPFVACAEDAPVSRVPVEPFFAFPDYTQVQLSPSGKYLAGIVQSNGRSALGFIDLDTMKPGTVASGADGDIVGFDWVNDERVVFWVGDRQAGSGEQRGGGLFTIKRDGTEFLTLAPGVKAQAGQGRYVLRGTRLLTTLDDGSDDILVESNESDARHADVYRMNTRNGRKALKTFGRPGDAIQWVADRTGAVRAVVTEEKGFSIQRSWWRATEDSPWVMIGEYKLRDERIQPVAFDGDGSLIVASNIGRDTMALYRYDTTKKALGELLAAHPQADLEDGLVYDRRKHKIVGVRYDAEKPGVAWFDDEWARLQAGVDKALPDHANAIARGTGPKVLVFSYSDRDPGTYFILDLTNPRLQQVATTRKTVKPNAMPVRRPVRYAARDGLEIPGYLTLPNDREAKNLPLVVLVHGGPYVRGGHWHWSAEAAFLATLGYAVLEPEFRGSTSWGRKLYQSGWKQWGRAMQDDLNDGMDWLAKEGTIDPKRACIVGASYGGYAVMMGLARDPERWKCGVNYVGVTDLNLLFDVTWSDADAEFLKYMARETIGDPDKDAAQFKATSPLEQAARIKAPVLMAYGTQDVRVPVVHGQKMRDALKANGVPVEWVTYDEEGHGWGLEANRYDFYRRVAQFLDRNLGMP
jgi:dienelactone hydrolase